MLRVCLILFPEFQLLDHALAVEALRIANKSAAEKVFEWEVRSVTKDTVQASNSTAIAPDANHWDGAKSFDLVLVCAENDPLKAISPGLRAFLNQATRKGAVLGGLGRGPMVLATLGFLDGHTAVLHQEDSAELRDDHPDITLSHKPYCLKDKRLTAIGGIATLDALLAWVAEVVSPELAYATSEAMAYRVPPTEPEHQRIEPSEDPVLARMGQIMSDNIAAPCPVTDIANTLSLSLKQLRLRSQRGLGVTPSAYYHHLRLQAALTLVRTTQMPMTEIAQATGFATLASFSKSFRAEFQTSPRKLRATLAER